MIHLANVYSFWEADRRTYAKVNVEGTRNVMECALAAAIPRVVHVSSAVIYGRPADSPFTEESLLGPVRFSEYVRTKHAGDRIAWELHERRELPLVTILPGSLATAGAAFLTWLADRVGQPPPWGMSNDQIRTMREGFAFDGGKAARELGLVYTPIRIAVEEMIAATRVAGARAGAPAGAPTGAPAGAPAAGGSGSGSGSESGD